MLISWLLLIKHICYYSEESSTWNIPECTRESIKRCFSCSKWYILFYFSRTFQCFIIIYQVSPHNTRTTLIQGSLLSGVITTQIFSATLFTAFCKRLQNITQQTTDKQGVEHVPWTLWHGVELNLIHSPGSEESIINWNYFRDHFREYTIHSLQLHRYNWETRKRNEQVQVGMAS